jgi:molybdopterin/thiamine biosynthesis adenylyltransferase
MAGKFHHEALYRGADCLTKMAAVSITLCGAGALGSNLADNLVRQGVQQLRVIDRDRVEEHNVSTQLYGEADIGAWKVEVLRQRLFRTAGVEIQAERNELTERTAKGLLGGCGLIVDTFDNSTSRHLVQQQGRALQIPCLHVGLYADYGEVIWDESYRVPQDVAGDVCDYPLARNLVMLTVAVATETILRFALGGLRESRSVTLQDFSVRKLETPVDAVE